MIEFTEFTKLTFFPRMDRPEGSLRARVTYDNGVSVSITIGPGNLSETTEKPYEVYVTGSTEYDEARAT